MISAFFAAGRDGMERDVRVTAHHCETRDNGTGTAEPISIHTALALPLLETVGKGSGNVHVCCLGPVFWEVEWDDRAVIPHDWRADDRRWADDGQT
jgi:hypothetical protein